MSSTGFASVDGTDGFNTPGEHAEFEGIYRHKDDFGRVYFEVREEDCEALIEEHCDINANVNPFYLDDYWKCWMAKGKLDKSLGDINNFVKNVDNKLIFLVSGSVKHMAEGSKIEGKPYNGSFLTITAATKLGAQPKEVLAASKEYLKQKLLNPTKVSAKKGSAKAKPKPKAKAKAKAKAKKAGKVEEEDMEEDEDEEDAAQEA